MKTSKTFRLNATTINRIDAIAKKQGITATEVITRAINVYFAIANADWQRDGDEETMKACAYFAYLAQ